MIKNTLFLAAALALAPAVPAAACSGAVIAGDAAEGGRPLLWKNRDSSHFNNGVVHVRETPYSYTGITNEDDQGGRRVWAGLNSAGFAVMNTVAYNLPLGEEADLEGWLMADALRTCATVADFEAYLKRNLGPALGAQANFGVIDAAGGAALFEVFNTSFTRLDAGTSGALPVTNFSRSGKPDKGKGYIRFARVSQLLAGVKPGEHSAARILQDFTRDLVNPLLGPAAPGAKLLHTAHTVNRASTVSAVVFQGVRKGQPPAEAIMWVMAGEPVASVAVPLWVAAGEVPYELSGATAAPANMESSRLRKLLREGDNEEYQEYLNPARLDDGRGGGWLEPLRSAERRIIANTAAFAAGLPAPSAAARAAFQREAAAAALAALKAAR